ncbi:MAG TPA: hypothetical protein VEC17_01430 [Candidatus Binatia bacterium]|nr:hypothetical protein [Candidatus Binatia bacterium]
MAVFPYEQFKWRREEFDRKVRELRTLHYFSTILMVLGIVAAPMIAHKAFILMQRRPGYISYN